MKPANFVNRGESMRVFILNTGYLETDRNCVVACGTIGTYSTPHIQNQ